MDILQKLEGKIVFFDFDGVLGSYQATTSKVHIPEREYIARQVLNDNPYSATKAPSTIVNLIKQLDSNKVYVLSGADSSFEQKNKIEFIKKNYPSIKPEHIIFVSSQKYKVVIIHSMWERYFCNILSKQDIVMIDDEIPTISLIEDAGFTCYHISSVLN